MLTKLLTRSFPGKSNEPSTARLQDEALLPELANYESKALKLWFENVSESEQADILDLGPASNHVLTLCQSLGRLTVCNMNADSLELAPNKLAADLCQSIGENRYAGALIWDYVNFLDPDQLKEVGKVLAKNMLPAGSVMVGLFTRDPVPEAPGTYQFLPDWRIAYQPQKFSTEKSHRYTPGELAKLWPEFESDRAYLLQHGVHEVVLRKR